ncbi:MAG: TetR/AcrR family transcriptional regulator [Algicola sp.]|nr:TetR/AcrR family transcriptional regulator [Algicola sp.]
MNKKNDLLETGRKAQKKKTRKQLLQSAQDLLSLGKPFSLEDVAKHSNTSRATVYRYFSNIDVLCSEAGLDIHTKSPDTLFDEFQHLSIIERIIAIQNYYNQLALDNEMAFRTYLSVYLKDDKSATRGSRRVESLKLALSPVRDQIQKKEYHHLIHSATILMGIEPMIAAKDVCQLSNEKAIETLKWTLQILLEKTILNKVQ